MIDFALQGLIIASASAAIWLLSDPRPSRRMLGCWIGLAGQPAWIYSAAAAGQWGIVALTVWYALAYARGIRQNRAPAVWHRHPPHNSVRWLTEQDRKRINRQAADDLNTNCGADRP